MSLNKHSVFVLGVDGKPLTPTTLAKARKLLEAGQAKKKWSKDVFSSHCCDSLTLACHVSALRSLTPGPFLVVDDTYRPVRRQLHDTQPAKGGIRANYSKGTVFGLRKGLLIGTIKGRIGRLCGENNGGFRYYDQTGKRQSAKHLAWVSSQFIIKQGNSSR